MESPPTSLLILIVSLFVANLSVFPSSSHNPNNDIFRCLADQFKLSNVSEVIFTPSNASYASLQQYENLRATTTSPRKPLLIVTPYHESEIQTTIHCSRKLGVQIRVRSGGHDYEGLSYTSRDPFIIVDMRNLRSVEVDKNRETVWVQTGATLGELYYMLAKVSKTLTVPAGVCPTVGVGGHFSGGGYGMVSRQHGLASDHIIDAKLVDADGKILDRRSMGEDLFWALRGGGSASFGIIVAFKVSLVVVPETVTTFEVARSSEHNVTRLVQRWQNVAHKVDSNLLLRVSLNSVAATPTSNGNRTIAAYFNALYLGRADRLLSLMSREFPELELVRKECNEMSWIDSVMFFANLRNHSLDVLLSRVPQKPYTPGYYKGKSDFVTTPIPTDGFARIWSFLHEEAEYRGALEFSPYGGALSNFAETESPFPHRAGKIFMIRYGVTWDTDGDQELRKHMEWIRRLYGYMTPYVTKSPREAYFNYKDLDIGTNNDQGNTRYKEASVWGHKYYKNNFHRLVRAKTKVDPSNFFRNEQSIPTVTHI